jgi:hypothetical protein
VAITREVLEWYAPKIGMNASNATELAETKRRLDNQLRGGYWKIVSRGDALTEKAGDCDQQYCLVRGIGACTSCREKDQMINPAKSSPPPQWEHKNDSQIPANPEAQTFRLIRRLINWLGQLFWEGGRQ